MSYVKDDPFAALGLQARAGLPDEEVRAAWKRIAAATHPDREDGGDAARYAAAAAAYDALRTSFGRGEALADLGQGGRALGFRGQRAAVSRGPRPGFARARLAGRAARRRGRRGDGRRRARRRVDARHRRAARRRAHLGGGGYGPTAIGRAGSVIQFDHEPT